jgi:hypothetical protein
VLTHVRVETRQFCLDLGRVIATHDPRELGDGVLDKEVAELSIDVGLHVA